MRPPTPPTSGVGGSSQDRSRDMEWVGRVGTCAVGGGHAAGVVGAVVVVDDIEQVDGRDSHRRGPRGPNWGPGQTGGMGRGRHRGRECKERRWGEMVGEGCWRFGERAMGAKVEEGERANGWPSKVPDRLAARCDA